MVTYMKENSTRRVRRTARVSSSVRRASATRGTGATTSAMAEAESSLRMGAFMRDYGMRICSKDSARSKLLIKLMKGLIVRA